MDDREKLIELQRTNCGIDKPCESNCLECMTDHLIANGVTVQKHGRWEFNGKTAGGNTVLVCSECRHDRVQQFFKEFDRYCPECGAKMDV